MTHKLFGTYTAVTDEGSIDLKEIKCGAKYVSVEFGSNYCPQCGDEL